MLLEKNKLLLLVILVLSGGMFNSSLMTVEEAEDYDNPDYEILKLFTNVYEIETYVSGCERAMYENGRFYNSSDIINCKKIVNEKFEDEIDDFDKPDFKFFTIENTDYRAEFSKDIYRIDIFGTYCENVDFSDILARNTKCTNQKIGRLFMTQNAASNGWGFAVEGFQTTEGKYLEVIRP